MYKKSRLKAHDFNRGMKGGVARHPLLGMVEQPICWIIERMSGTNPTGSGFIPVYVMILGSSGEPISPTG
jgi:hypothetical protein